MVEAGYFQQADKFLKNLTKKTLAKPLITRLIKNTNLPDLTKNLELLEEIEKKLEDYLEVKRRLFSRFYFISNDELVEILANSNSMNIVQKHVNKLF
jgi:dynein heavy chain